MTMKPAILATWIRASAIGWLAGLFLVIALAMVWDAIGGSVQFIVGVGMGAGVGFFQARVLKSWIPSSRWWLLISTLGMGLPFALWDATAAAGGNPFFSQGTSVLLGSLLVGIGQAQVLRPHSGRALLWIPACVLGWGLPSGLLTLGQSDFGGPVWRVVSVTMIFLGGIVLGAVSGQALGWILRAESSVPVDS